MPGAAAGLEHAHRRFGSLPWRDLVAPAIDLARDGVEVTPTQAYLHEILVAIIGPAPGVGERLRFVDFAATLERIADEGTAFLSTGDVARALCEIAPQITLEDLAGYRVITRRPVATTFRSHEFASNPPPSSGGVLIAYGLQLLERARVLRAGRPDRDDARAERRARPALPLAAVPRRPRAPARRRAVDDDAHLRRRCGGERGVALVLDRLGLRRRRSRARVCP